MEAKKNIEIKQPDEVLPQKKKKKKRKDIKLKAGFSET